MIEIIFATGNPHKVEELEAMLPDNIKIKSLKDIGFTEDIPEDHETFHENAFQKAHYIANRFEVNCFGEDSGLEVFAINKEPGVYSARYAGEERDHGKNIKKLLNKMEGMTDRSARFVSSIALILNGKEYLFEGEILGSIGTAEQGTGGFGYDPIFIPDGYQDSFGVLSNEIKNSISHRSKSVEKLIAFLKEYV